jgi:hypothetical protein
MQTTLTVTVLGAQCVSFTNDKGQEQTMAKIFICNPALPGEADKFKGLAVQTMDTTPDLYKSLTLPAAPVTAELTVSIKTAAKGKAGFLVEGLRVLDPAVSKKAS